MDDTALEQHAGFSSIKESTREDRDIIVRRYKPFARELPERTLGHLKLQGHDDGGFAVTRLHHSLLTAALAH